MPESLQRVVSDLALDHDIEESRIATGIGPGACRPVSVAAAGRAREHVYQAIKPASGDAPTRG